MEKSLPDTIEVRSENSYDWSNVEIEHIERYGEDEGEPCLFNGCDGTIEVVRDPCSCAVVSMPPCSACENARLLCDTCERDPYDD